MPKTKVKWTYSFVKCSGTQEKEYEWNHGYVCGWAPMMKFIQLYIFTKIGN